VGSRQRSPAQPDANHPGPHTHMHPGEGDVGQDALSAIGARSEDLYCGRSHRLGSFNSSDLQTGKCCKTPGRDHVQIGECR
jgi:hypothetical protein